MRIGIDARELCGRPTGVGRYLGGLLAEWATSRAASRPRVRALRARAARRRRSTRGASPTRLVAGPAGTWWEQVPLPRAAARDHLDVFFAPATRRRSLSRADGRRHPRRVVRRPPRMVSAARGLRRRWLTRRRGRAARGPSSRSRSSRGAKSSSTSACPTRAIHVIPPGVAQPPSRARPRRAARARACCTSGRSSIAGTSPDLDPRVRAAGARAHPDASLDHRRRQPQLSRTKTSSGAIAAEELGGASAGIGRSTDDQLARAVLRARARLRSCRSTRAGADAARGAGGRRAAGAARHAGRARELRRGGAVRRAGTTSAGDGTPSSGCCSTSATRTRLLSAAPGVLARVQLAASPRGRRWR